MRRWIVWIAIPLSFVAIAIVLEPSRTAAPRPTTALSPLDAKLARTVRSFGAIDTERQIDRPGLRIDLFMAPEDFVDFTQAWSHHAGVQIAFDGGPRRSAMVRIRGGSSRRSERKSFRVTLFEPQRFADFTLEKFLLLNMLYDPGNFEMYLSNRLLGELGLFPAYQQYVVVYMNGESRGLYLLVERPEDAIRRTSPAAVSVLRPHKNGATLKYSAQLTTPLLLNDRLRQLARAGGGVQIQQELDRVIKLDKYLVWLAFNSLVENGDARDEIFLYEERAPGEELGRLDLVAWDYDDVQQPPLRAAEVIEDPLLYACEMELDSLIQRTPTLYASYKRVLRRLLMETLTEAELTKALEDVGQILDEVDRALAPNAHTLERADRRHLMQQFESRLLQRRLLLLELLDRS